MGYKILRSHSPEQFFIALAIGLLLKSNTAILVFYYIWFIEEIFGLVKMKTNQAKQILSNLSTALQFGLAIAGLNSTPWDLVTPCGDIDLGQHCLR